MWSDIDSKKDFLNYSEASEIVVNVLKNPSMLPISIGVFGSWGTVGVICNDGGRGWYFAITWPRIADITLYHHGVVFDLFDMLGHW